MSSTWNPAIDHNSYLIVGSAPYVSRWWAINSKEVVESKLKVCPINNAWSIIGAENIHRWFVPNDFYATGTVIPTDGVIESIREICGVDSAGAIRRDSQAKINAYKGKTSGQNPPPDLKRCFESHLRPRSSENTGTMFVNAMRVTMNHAYENRENIGIYIIGSDFDYTDGCHFYENHPGYKGSKDPLRYGLEYLQSELQALKSVCDEFGYNIYNLSNSKNTLLPFVQIEKVVE